MGLYCRSGGSNLNAGNRNGSAGEPGTSAAFTYASGNWVQSTGVFTVASGNPLSDGIAVGDYASVYADGATETAFVGYVTARTSTTITVSLTTKIGTAPTDGTGNRTLRIGGAWQGPNGASAFPFNLSSSVSLFDPFVYLKNDQVYSVTASITVNTANNPVFVEGYSATIGDGGRAIIDGGTSGASYAIINTSGVRTRFNYIEVRNNGATGSVVAFAGTGGGVYCYRCVVHDVRGPGLQVAVAVECETYACNQSNTTNLGGFHGVGLCVSCIAHDNVGSNADGYFGCTYLINCIADSNGRNGTSAGSDIYCFNCDFYNNGADAMNTSTGSGIQYWFVINCNFVKNGGYAMSRLGGIVYTHEANCGFGSGTQANTSGTNNNSVLYQVGRVNYAADLTPWVDPANGDFRINLATAIGTGRGSYTQSAASYAGTVGYPDIGAAQALVSGGSGGLRVHPGMVGGMNG